MSFLARLAEDIGNRYQPSKNGAKLANPATGPQPPGRFSFGTQLQGGPRFTDANQSKPAPSLLQLVENYHALIYAMVACNRDAVTRLPMRLLADGSRVQGKPSRACDPIRVSRSVAKRAIANADNRISGGAIDQIYEIRNHPFLDVLDNPDPYGNFSREKLLGLMVSYMDVVGSAYLVPEGNGWDWTDATARVKGPPQFLWVVYPQYTIPIRLNASPIVDHFMYFADWLPRDSVIWFRHNHSLRDAYGSSFSPTYAGEPYRSQEQEQIAIATQILSLGPRPNLIASAKDAMMTPGEKEAQAFEIDLKRKQAGGYAGGILVNRGAWEFTSPDYPMQDEAGLNWSMHDIYMLAAIFGQPPTYYTVDSNLANLQAADAQHARKGVEPRCKTIASTFTQLAKRFDPRLFFQFDPALPEDDLQQAQVDKIYFDMGAVTANQLNEEKKYPPAEWGEEPLINKSMVTWSMLKEQHEQSMKQADQMMQSGGIKDDLAIDGHLHQKEMDQGQQKLAEKDQKIKEKQLAKKAERLLAEIESCMRQAS